MHKYKIYYNHPRENIIDYYKYILIILFIPQLLFAQTEFWEQANGPYYVDVTSMVVGTNNAIYSGINYLGIYRSTNKGSSWIYKNGDLNDYNILSMVLKKSGNIFVATTNGVFRSSDDGDSWIGINNGLSGIGIVSLFIKSNGDIFAGTYSQGVYRTTDNGANWTPMNSGLDNKSVWSFTENLNRDIFAGTEGSIFKSTDNGKKQKMAYLLEH